MHRILMHMDADGYASGAIVAHKLLQDGIPRENIYFHPINYGMDIPPEINYEEDTVYLVDFSLQPDEVMRDFANKLHENRSVLIWIDHHKTALHTEVQMKLSWVNGIRAEFNKDVDFIVPGDDDMPLAGCELTWVYFFPKLPIPPVIELIGDWDTWRHETFKKNTDDASAFQMFLKTFRYSPIHSQSWWAKAFKVKKDEDLLKSWLTTGYEILTYQQGVDGSLMKAKAFECQFDGIPAIAVNQGGNSKMFDTAFDPKRHDIMVTFQWVGMDYITVSLYTPKTDKHNVGEIARLLGHAGDIPSGGGHPGAAGFQCGWDYFVSLITNAKKL